jgi:transcriptional regulator NrdR family protein
MKCSEPKCDAETHILETRISGEGVRRRRECIHGHKFSTLELPMQDAKQYLKLGRLIADMVVRKNP